MILRYILIRLSWCNNSRGDHHETLNPRGHRSRRPRGHTRRVQCSVSRGLPLFLWGNPIRAYSGYRNYNSYSSGYGNFGTYNKSGFYTTPFGYGGFYKTGTYAGPYALGSWNSYSYNPFTLQYSYSVGSYNPFNSYSYTTFGWGY